MKGLLNGKPLLCPVKMPENLFPELLENPSFCPMGDDFGVRGVSGQAYTVFDRGNKYKLRVFCSAEAEG